MSTKAGLLFAGAVFVAGAVVNLALGAVAKGHMRCYAGSCGSISLLCLSETGACSWCTGNATGSFCGHMFGATCNAEGDLDCGGVTYTGSCVRAPGEGEWWECSGTMNPSTGCIRPACQGGVTPPNVPQP